MIAVLHIDQPRAQLWTNVAVFSVLVAAYWLFKRRPCA